MKLAMFLAGALIAAPLSALEWQGNSLVFTDAEMQRCHAEGGCIAATMQQLEQAMQQVRDRTAKEALIGCRNWTGSNA